MVPELIQKFMGDKIPDDKEPIELVEFSLRWCQARIVQSVLVSLLMTFLSLNGARCHIGNCVKLLGCLSPSCFRTGCRKKWADGWGKVGWQQHSFCYLLNVFKVKPVTLARPLHGHPRVPFRLMPCRLKLFMSLSVLIRITGKVMPSLRDAIAGMCFKGLACCSLRTSKVFIKDMLSQSRGKVLMCACVAT